jgi:GAF domain-containing protein
VGGVDQREGVDESIFDTLALLARAMHVKNGQLQPTLDAIVASTVDAVPAARHAGLILVMKGELVPQATTGRPPHELDLLQQRLQTGPCIEAAQRQEVILVADTDADQQWPVFSAAAVQLRVCSMLCMPLWVDDRTLGTLSLYAEQRHAFVESDERQLEAFGALAAIALSTALNSEQLQTAMRNRDVIGQAKGILMERLRLTEDGAFALLAKTSQHQNKRLVAVAQSFVETGDLGE